MDLYASEDFRARIGRWRRAAATLYQRAKRAAPTLCPIGGAVLGFALSLGSGSWLLIAGATLLGTVLGGLLVALPILLYEGARIILIRTAVFAAVLIVVVALVRALLGV
jgi:hypothetical protein